MIIDIKEDENFKDLMEQQIDTIIDYLLKNNEEFSIVANIDGVNFEPKIPKSIYNTFSNFTLFALQGYTYSTIEIKNNHISFEAGFGKENFGSIVTMPFYAIFQITINNSILFLNPTSSVEKYFLDENIDQEKRSKNVFSKL
jgi:hypothetical protein